MEMACDAALKNRRYDAEGRLHILRTPISKATVNPYYGREIPDSEKLGLQPERIYYLLRDPGELAKAASSFARVQLMFKHIAVSADDPKQDSIAGTVGSEVQFEAPYLVADLCVWDAEAIAGIETDTVRELSCSYRYRADMTPGVYQGQRYDGVMRDIQGNHVALVKAGRAGSDVMAADSQLETTMETKFGRMIYAMLRAISPTRLAKDEALKPLVIGLTPKTFDYSALEPKLLAMDAALPREDMSKAMAAANKVAGDEDDNAEKYADKAEKGGDKKAKDWEFDDFASDKKKKAKDAEEDDEDEKLDEEEKDDPQGQDKKKAKDGKKAKDRIAKDAQTAEERAMWAQMRKDGSADDPNDDSMPASLRKANDKRANDMKIAMDEFKAELRDAEDARRAVRPVVGDVLAQDSAEEIYDFALDEMKVEHKGVQGVTALRALFNLAQQVSKPSPKMAFDSTGIEEKFPGATRRINVM
ncbi:MAG: DUF2213 domain-containing protein [Sulfobacillus sp.]